MPGENFRTIAESDQYTVWEDNPPDGSPTMHIEAGNLSLHFLMDDWREFSDVVTRAVVSVKGGAGDVHGNNR